MNGHPAGTTSRSNATFEFSVPAGTTFAVPVEQVVVGIPPEVGPKGHFLRVTGSDNQQYYVPEGSLLLRPGRRDIPKGANYNPQETYSKKELQLAEWKSHAKKLESELNEERSELKAARKQVNKLQQDVQGYKDGYRAMSSAAEENNENYIFQYNMRIKEQQEWKATLNEMRSRVFELGSENEENKITEDDLLKDYKNLIETIKAATGGMTFHLDQDAGPQKQTVLSSLWYANATTANDLELFNVRLPSILLHVMLDHIGKEFYTGLAEISVRNVQDGQSQAVGGGFDVFENEVTDRIELGRQEIAKVRGKGKTTTQSAASQAVLMRSFYRWRSDTVRLLGLLNKQNLPVSDKAKARIVETVSAQFFIALKPQGTEEAFDPADLFQGADFGNKTRANARLNQFIKKLDEGVGKAMAMFIRLRTCRANYEFEWYTPQNLDRTSMEISEAHSLTEKDRRRHQETTLRVLDCRFPALIKYGEDDGKNYNIPKVVEKAEVIIDGLVSEPVQEDRGISAKGQVGKGAENNGITALPDPISNTSIRARNSFTGQSKASTEDVNESNKATADKVEKAGKKYGTNRFSVFVKSIVRSTAEKSVEAENPANSEPQGKAETPSNHAEHQYVPQNGSPLRDEHQSVHHDHDPSSFSKVNIRLSTKLNLTSLQSRAKIRQCTNPNSISSSTRVNIGHGNV